MRLKETLKGNVNYCIKQYKMMRYLKSKSKVEQNMDTIDYGRILYIVVAFNHVDLIRYQYKALKKFCKEKFSYLVADNSNDIEQSSFIEDFCVENEIAYIKLPFNLFDGSDSHAVALNWICRNILKTLRKIDYIGFIDHDCFPVKEIGIISKMDIILKDQNFYGLEQNRGQRWYLWLGFLFFRVAHTNIRRLDFRCTKWGDTGSAMYEKLFAKYRASTEFIFAEQQYQPILEVPTGV